MKMLKDITTLLALLVGFFLYFLAAHAPHLNKDLFEFYDKKYRN